MSSLQEKLGARIQELRKSRNISQEKLAEAIGLNVPNMSNLERGKKFVSAKTLENITKSLNVTEKELFDFNHCASKEELYALINDILEHSTEQEMRYFYRMMCVYKESHPNILKKIKI